ncbi:MAG TPA: hypothetical protein VK550_23865, partial [Polyangiaceae bacterium]|nr:hypothetical protein [Polyangiaceae bacterium]
MKLRHAPFVTTRTRRFVILCLLLAAASCSDILGFEHGHLVEDGGQTAGSGGTSSDASPRDGAGGRDGSLPGDVAADVRIDVSSDAADGARADISVDVADATGFDAADASRGDATPDAPRVDPDAGPDVVGRCSAATCSTGCCGPNDTCVPSTNDACGTAGAACVACAQGQECSQGACRCGPTCTTGCCASTGACLTPTKDACGSPGNACTQCADGQTCDATGKCVCNPASCPGGCCDA